MRVADAQVQIRNALVETLAADLVGPMRDDEALLTTPSRWYLTGFLVPTGAPEEQRTDALADEAGENQVDARETDETADDVRPAKAFLPSSMGLAVLVPAGVEHLEVHVSWGDYAPLDEAETRALLTQARSAPGSGSGGATPTAGPGRRR